jgi:hypothetical protein
LTTADVRAEDRRSSWYIISIHSYFTTLNDASVVHPTNS